MSSSAPANTPQDHVTPPSTPSRPTIPPFSPRTPRHGARPVTPESDDSDGESPLIALANLPKGHQLVVRGCISTDPNESPVFLVKQALTTLATDSRFEFFNSLQTVVTPFSERTSNISAACYVELKSENGAEPRVDLLEMIRDALGEIKPNWEIRWSASRKGRSDKRLSCRLLNLYPGVVDRTGIPAEHLPLISAHIEKMGFKVASIFASYGGPQITFLLPADADRFFALSTIAVPSKVSKLRASIEPLKEVPILHAFELVIKGARDFDGLGDLVGKWIRKTAPGSLLDMRSTPVNPDLIIFSMSTWAATSLILKSTASFAKTFPHDSILSPRLLWDYNDDPLNKSSLGDQVARGASQISGSVAALSREVNELKSGLAAVQHQQALMSSNQDKMLDFITCLDRRITTTQNAMLVQGMEHQYRSKVGDIEGQMNSMRVAMMFTPDADQKALMQAEYDSLAVRLSEAKGCLNQATHQLGVAMGGPAVPPPPPILPAPPTASSTPSSSKRKRTDLPSQPVSTPGSTAPANARSETAPKSPPAAQSPSHVPDPDDDMYGDP